MWRFDGGRTATSPHELPGNISLSWSKKFTPRMQAWDDTLNNDLMQYDRILEPIVMGSNVIVGFNDTDKVVAWNIRTGEESWRFYTDGPVRFPPSGANGRVFVTSDDGHLYCLDAQDGSLNWKFRGGPGDRKVLGNRRVISMWPARGGPVVDDEHVYFAASIWPFMGTFIYSLDAETGDVVWVNDKTSASYIKQPHSAPSFAGVAPQGALALSDDSLIVPGGRSVPAVFDRQTGELSHFHLNAGGKGNGGSFVMTHDEHYYVHTRDRGVRRFNLETGNKTALMLNEPVLDGDVLITSDDESVKAIKSNDNGTEKTTVWELPVDGRGDLIRAGRRIYAAGEKEITVLELAEDSSSATVVDRLAIPNVQRLVAGGSSLIAVTHDGLLSCLSKPEDAQPNSDRNSAPAVATKTTDVGSEATVAESLLSDPLTTEFLREREAINGYGFAFGVRDHSVVDQLLTGSNLHIVAVSENQAVVDQLRQRYDNRGIYGTRVTVHHGTPDSFLAPSYIARAVIVQSDDPEYLKPETLTQLFASVRPYGGFLWFPDSQEVAKIQDACNPAIVDSSFKVTQTQRGVSVSRVAGLTGAAPWTHMYGDVANTVKSNDRVVKAPLGLLWFGGNTHHDILPRHSHAPGEQVLGGRLFIEGMNSLSARDVYTGQRLWKRDFESLGTEGVYFDETYANTPLSTKYNQVHIPGANARGTNYVATEEAIYLVKEDRCLVLSPASGETLREIVLPPEVNPKGTATWTYIGVFNNMLIAGVDFANATDASVLFKELAKKTKRGAAWSPAWFASRRVAVLDAETGELLWHRDAKHSFLHNGIVAGDDTVFLLDKLPQSIEDQRSRRGTPKPDDYNISALNVATGEVRWETTDNVFGTWLGYSGRNGTLIHAGSGAPDRSMDEVKAGIIALRGDSGDVLWHTPGLEYSGPCIIHNDRIIMNSRSYAPTSGVVSILDGKPILLENPLTGEKDPWTYRRAYGCNTAIASEHLLTFRSGAAGYYDLNMQCGVANLGGFRSGCTSNLIAADGVLNAPDFTRTCSCGYQNQTSLALVHMPDVEVWTLNPFQLPDEQQGFVSNLGINFGAAGTRRADDGTVWMEYPPAMEDKFPLNMELEGDDAQFSRRHSSSQSGPYSWMKASSMRGFLSFGLQVCDPSAEREFSVQLHFPADVRAEEFYVEGSEQTLAGNDDLAEAPSQPHSKVFPRVRTQQGKIWIRAKTKSYDMANGLTGIEIRALQP